MGIALDEGDLTILKVLSDTTLSMIEGEIIGIEKEGAIHVTREEALEIIRRKTADLFAAACRLPAHFAPRGDLVAAERLAEYGRCLGMAFQLIDDLLDYTGSVAEVGKPVLNDLREGKLTMPLLLALPRASAAEREQVAAVLREREFKSVADVRDPRDRRPLRRHSRDARARARLRRRGARRARRVSGLRREGRPPARDRIGHRPHSLSRRRELTYLIQAKWTYFRYYIRAIEIATPSHTKEGNLAVPSKFLLRPIAESVHSAWMSAIPKRLDRPRRDAAEPLATPSWTVGSDGRGRPLLSAGAAWRRPKSATTSPWCSARRPCDVAPRHLAARLLLAKIYDRGLDDLEAAIGGLPEGHRARRLRRGGSALRRRARSARSPWSRRRKPSPASSRPAVSAPSGDSPRGTAAAFPTPPADNGPARSSAAGIAVDAPAAVRDQRPARRDSSENRMPPIPVGLDGLDRDPVHARSAAGARPRRPRGDRPAAACPRPPAGR